ncbi:MAG: hypothetical protein CMN93_08160 [Synechococcus sp. CPC35]|nr:hypothetical protein [Synechococcus sp. CPC35]
MRVAQTAAFVIGHLWIGAAGTIWCAALADALAERVGVRMAGACFGAVFCVWAHAWCVALVAAERPVRPFRPRLRFGRARSVARTGDPMMHVRYWESLQRCEVIALENIWQRKVARIRYMRAFRGFYHTFPLDVVRHIAHCASTGPCVYDCRKADGRTHDLYYRTQQLFVYTPI